LNTLLYRVKFDGAYTYYSEKSGLKGGMNLVINISSLFIRSSSITVADCLSRMIKPLN